MKYEINEDVKNLITQMCDLALKQGGMANKQGVDIVLNVLDNPVSDLREVKNED
jgi:hypothetical protein